MLTIGIFSDLLQRFIDNYILFTKRKQDFNDKFFHEILEPLYKQLEVIVKDYFQIFYSAEKIIKSETPDALVEKKEEIIALRRQNADQRIQVRSMIESFRKNIAITDDDLAAFIEYTNIFFYSSFSDKYQSMSASLVDYLVADHVDVAGAQHIIKLSLRDMEKAWSEINLAYGRLKIKMLMPKNFKHN